MLSCNCITAQHIMFASRDNPANNFEPLMVSVDMTTCGDAVRLPYPLKYTSPNGVRFAITPDSLCYFFDGVQEFYSIYKYTGNDFLPLVELFNYVLPVGRNQTATYGEDDWIYLGGTDLTRFHTRERRFEEYSIIKPGSISISGITRHKGELYYVERLDFGINQLNKLDDDLSTITTVIDTVDNIVVNDRFFIKSLQCHCEDVKLISYNPQQTIYEFDLDNKTRSPLCDIESIYPLDPNNARMHGQQSFIGFPEWSECALSIDLDLDDELIQKTRDYHLRDICGYTDLELSDDDVQVFASGGVIDSIVVEIVTPTRDQYLTGMPSSHVSIDGDGQSHVVLIGDGQETFDDYEEVIRSLRYIDAASEITITVKEVNFRAFRDTLSGQLATAFLHITEARMSAGEDTYIELCEVEDLDLNNYLPSDVVGGVWENLSGFIGIDELQDTSVSYITNGIICPADTATYFINIEPPAIEQIEQLEYCIGDSVVYEGQYYFNPTSFIDTLESIETGCDSIYKTIEINVLDQVMMLDIDTTLCVGEVFMIGNQTVDSPGTYTDTLSSVSGCDSLVTEITLSYASAEQLVVIDTLICSGTSIEIGGRLIENSTVEEFTIMNSIGCDSITYDISVRVSEVQDITIDTILCNGETIQIGNQIFSESTQELLLLVDSQGCDSITYDLIVRVSEVEEVTIDTTLCNGEMIQIGNQIFSEATQEELLLVDSQGCDSIQYVIDIEYKELQEEFIDTLLCAGEVFNFLGQRYTESGLEQIVVVGSEGCDSIIINVDLDFEQVSFLPDQSFEIPLSNPTQVIIDYDLDYDSVTWIPQEGLSCDDCLDPIVDLEQDATYQVEINPIGSCAEIINVQIKVIEEESEESDFYLPNVISISTSGNDKFFLQSGTDNIMTYSMSVYDRWGSQVFVSENINSNDASAGWGGRNYNGADLLQGVYVYKIVLEDGSVVSGDILVLR